MPSEKAPGSPEVRAQRSCWPLPGSADGERKRQRPPSEAARSPPSRGVPCRLHLLPHPVLFCLGRAAKEPTNLSSAGQDVATAQPVAVCNAAAGSHWSGHWEMARFRPASAGLGPRAVFVLRVLATAFQQGSGAQGCWRVARSWSKMR